MTSITRGHKIYFAAVGLLALSVGFTGYFLPAQVEIALPWFVPPLHARFLGAMYLSGTVFMLGAVRARQWAEVWVIMPMIVIWTGLLFVVSSLHLAEFDFAIPQTWVWFSAYLIYPLIALWLAIRYRPAGNAPAGPALPSWASNALLALGVLTSVPALALLFLPGMMAAVWPWTITPLLAHLYSAPFLSYGIGSLLLARCKTWSEVRISVTAIFVFALGVLLASLLHRQLFAPAVLADWLWFGSFSVAVILTALLALRARSSARP